ncbi:protein of unknown function [Chitinophaga costaii]|uniref:DUF3127 domain-containing protein n=1 Tax=Chitinophaga costaii TaxID=1335309 RepID=A0A1C4BEG4_9BACT|nr:DUF3127 domain-containing protein [Chitinophaga costaii]PUZ27644.1 DUF3127 domain-containing protein [Chitinophaga costaii]SCC05132.1 protein of unknown function [Chitinophaga costaii]
MSFEITGKLVVKYNTMQRSETFKTREFVIEKSDDINGRVITNYIKFQAVQDRTAIVDRFQEGENVKVYFNIKGTRWEKDGKVNYITNLDAWRMESIVANTPGVDPQPNYGGSQEFSGGAAPAATSNVDDLPF